VDIVMTSEELEFSISEYLDENLSAEASVALEARLNADAAARALLDEYRQLNSALKAPVDLPEIRWDQLATQLSSAVSDDAEQFEFALGQLADGTLAAEELPRVEARLLGNPAASSFLQAENRLTQVLKSPDFLPAVRWDRYAAHLSAAVAEASDPPSIKLFPTGWQFAAAKWAVAAAVVICSIIGVRGYLAHHPNPSSEIAKATQPVPSPQMVAVANQKIDVQIGGSDFQPTAGPMVAEINIGAGPDSAGAEVPSFAEGIIARSPRSLIASSSPVEQDSSMMPY
jgi:hypothetical protein